MNATTARRTAALWQQVLGRHGFLNPFMGRALSGRDEAVERLSMVCRGALRWRQDSALPRHNGLPTETALFGTHHEHPGDPPVQMALAGSVFEGSFDDATAASLDSIFDGILLMAVPKKKTTYSKKRMRSAGKVLKAKSNITQCEECGRPKMPHTYCTERCPGRRNRTPGGFFDGPTVET
eukprot:Plantae.Rhodophyta-Rhodochaete_pulchella.ctg19643.p1 GENE.Plantae.Rhodophyta-Rhodochaete_pulchella.ctg19643~~Plantae.Rhodophyta-Rhodochaete_pulchella.ctg19643.p1  ORF type:complete len:180 (+),score=20.96 Plantae.Rhodophyta-Rhodochaete_pulchella.ctg19643:47-586(+)